MNYAELKTAISAWGHRNDLSANADTFIDLVEARASRNLRALEMETLEIVVPSGVTQALPTGFMGFKNIQVNLSYTKTLEYASPQKLALAGLTSGDPHYYTINGNLVEFSPSASGSNVEWAYYKAIPALSDTNTSNWLISKHPDYYLMGCIQQVRIFSGKGEDAQTEIQLQGIERKINSAAKTAMSGPIVVVAR